MARLAQQRKKQVVTYFLLSVQNESILSSDFDRHKQENLFLNQGLTWKVVDLQRQLLMG